MIPAVTVQCKAKLSTSNMLLMFLQCSQLSSVTHCDSNGELSCFKEANYDEARQSIKNIDILKSLLYNVCDVYEDLKN